MQYQPTKSKLAKFVEDQVGSGNFDSPEAVIEDALERMMEELAPLTPEEQTAVDTAEAQIMRGEYRAWPEVEKEFRTKYLGE